VPRGRIAVGALETATALRLPPILVAYAARCPEVDIEIVTGTSAELVDAVLARRLEVAFVAGPVRHAHLEARPMIAEELVLVTAPGVAGLDELRSLAGTGKLKLVVFRRGCTYRARLEAMLAAQGILDPRRLEFGTLDGILGCVAAGIGVTLLPRAVVARAAAEGRVRIHSLPSAKSRVETVLIRRYDAFISTALARFIEIAERALCPPRRTQ